VTHQKIKISYLSSEQVKDLNNLKIWESLNINAVIIPQPSFLGDIQAVDDLVDWAREENSNSNKTKALVIGLVNPIAMSLFL
jgi:glycine cleavage system pyridoxal-binding protein P